MWPRAALVTLDTGLGTIPGTTEEVTDFSDVSVGVLVSDDVGGTSLLPPRLSS